MLFFRLRISSVVSIVALLLAFVTLVSSDSSSITSANGKNSELSKLLEYLRDESNSEDGVQVFVVKHPFAERRKAERARLAAANEKKMQQAILRKQLRDEQRRRQQQQDDSMMEVNPAPPEFQRMIKDSRSQYHEEVKHNRVKPTLSTTPSPLQRKERGFLHAPLVPIVPVVPLVKVGYIYTPPTTRGYIYKKPTTTTTTTPTTTPEPAIEADLDLGSDSVPPPPPPSAEPEAEVELAPEGPPELDEWDIRDAVPGSPGDDYPVHGRIPRTRFSCEGRTPGYYADPDTRCQVFHRCSDCGENVRLYMDTFICPNGTQFNQEVLSCDWWGNVNCATAPNYYGLNEQIGALARDGSYVQFSGKRVAPELRRKKVEPRIIPKDERRTLPDIYRNFHTHSDHGHGGGWSSDSHTASSRIPAAPAPVAPAPTPAGPKPKPAIQFEEFGKVRPDGSSGDPIQEVLDNPDYFNPDADQVVQTPKPHTTTTTTPSTVTPAAAVPTVDAGDLFDYDASLISERKSTELDIDAGKLDEPTSTSTTTASTTTTSTTTEGTTTTATLKPAKIEFVALQAKLNPRESGAEPNERKGDDGASGFIVNRRPSNLAQDELSVDITPPKEGEKPGTFTDQFESVIQSDADYSPLPFPTSSPRASSSSSSSSSAGGAQEITYLPPIHSYGPPAPPPAEYGPPPAPVKTVYVQSGYGAPPPIKETYLPPQVYYSSPKVYQYAPTYYTQRSPPVYISPAPVAVARPIAPQIPVIHPATYVFGQQASYDSYRPSSYEHYTVDESPKYSTSYEEPPPTIVKYNPPPPPSTAHFVNPHLTYSPPPEDEAPVKTTHIHASAYFHAGSLDEI